MRARQRSSWRRKTSTERSVLADVNVWLASIVAEHPHHDAAIGWWNEDVLPTSTTVAFCRVTQLGLLRLLTHRSVMSPQRQTISQAWERYDQLAAQRPVSFADEPPGLSERMRALCDTARSSPSFWTNAYLAAFALSCGFRLATFDKGLRKFRALDLILLR